MNKTVLVATLLLGALGGALHGDETSVTVAGGVPRWSALQGSDRVEMRSQFVRLTLLPDSCLTEAEYELVNVGEATDGELAFPQGQWGTRAAGEFQGLEVTVDGEMRELRAVTPKEPMEVGPAVIHRWWAVKLHFEKNQVLRAWVRYTTSTRGGSVVHFLGTDAGGRRPVGTATFEINNAGQQWISAVALDGVLPWEAIYDPSFDLDRVGHVSVSVQDTRTTLVVQNLNPRALDALQVDVGPAPPSLLGPHVVKPAQGWYYSEREIPRWLLRFRTDQQLRLERNLIFAGAGHIFESPEINQWLGVYASDFYRPTKKVSIQDLRPMELRNVNTLVAEEARRKEGTPRERTTP